MSAESLLEAEPILLCNDVPSLARALGADVLLAKA